MPFLYFFPQTFIATYDADCKLIYLPVHLSRLFSLFYFAYKLTALLLRDCHASSSYIQSIDRKQPYAYKFVSLNFIYA